MSTVDERAVYSCIDALGIVRTYIHAASMASHALEGEDREAFWKLCDLADEQIMCVRYMLYDAVGEKPPGGA
ncbi:hypothetical protein IFT66_14720 [Rhizobium sp. CFBP 13726]|uniref:hypothetical protein n=1 Tax=Rhizobium sp. CFBP 13726 TaxID=2775296 RepID=UPI001780732F|nr:hypothetical protein [Rhizobium sp. CFBP 13726]MBD8652339.1 hypothetical protein [Rhizobium sp. CFBP 13726]